PLIGGEQTPGELVQKRQEDEEARPAEGKLAPPFLGQREDIAEEIAQQRLAEVEPAEQNRREDAVDDGGLQLDEQLVLQKQREAAEDHDHEGGDERHHRDASEQDAGGGERDQCRGDEKAGA